jgi:DNA topoisomerase IB
MDQAHPERGNQRRLSGLRRASVLEHRESATNAGLRYVSDGVRGISRRRVGTGWAYYAPDGARITDAQ